MVKPGFVPINGHVLVKRKTNNTGLSITKEMQRGVHSDQGVIWDCGDVGFWFKYVKGVKTGRTIHFTKYSPVTIVDGDEDYIYVHKKNILSINK